MGSAEFGTIDTMPLHCWPLCTFQGSLHYLKVCNDNAGGDDDYDSEDMLTVMTTRW